MHVARANEGLNLAGTAERCLCMCMQQPAVLMHAGLVCSTTFLPTHKPGAMQHAQLPAAAWHRQPLMPSLHR